MRRARGWLPLLAISLPACGGGGPSSPTAPTSQPQATVLTVLSGETERPVAGATVTVSGRNHTSDAVGQVTVQDTVRSGALVDVVAAGFLDRQTSFRTGTTRYTLWPRSSPSGLDEEFTARIVYTAASGEDPPFAALPLTRLRPEVSSVVIVPDAAILADGAALAMHERAVAVINDAGAGAVTYALAREAPASGSLFRARLDADDEDCRTLSIRAYVEFTGRSGEITGGTIVYCSKDAARSATVAHEVGHTFGLRHSPNSRELMGVPFSRQRATSFSDREALAMALLLQRRGGNRFPDNDREATTTGVSGRVRILCE